MDIQQSTIKYIIVQSQSSNILSERAARKGDANIRNQFSQDALFYYTVSLSIIIVYLDCCWYLWISNKIVFLGIWLDNMMSDIWIVYWFTKSRKWFTFLNFVLLWQIFSTKIKTAFTICKMFSLIYFVRNDSFHKYDTLKICVKHTVSKWCTKISCQNQNEHKNNTTYLINLYLFRSYERLFWNH